MQELFDDKDFFDWLRSISRGYGNAMSEWGQAVHDAVSAGSPAAISRLVAATDAAVERLVAMLMAVGRRHEDSSTPAKGHDVLDAMDNLLAASAEMLRDARTGLAARGVSALATLAARVADLRALEAEVERVSMQLNTKVTDTFGSPEA